MTVTGLRSWSWIPVYWALVYAGLTAASIMLSAITGQSYSLVLFAFGVPLVIVPLTYGKLVGGACSLRFHICALVKGIMAGLVFAVLSVVTDSLFWTLVNPTLLLGHPMYDSSSALIYLIWLFSGMIGGFGARIREVQAGNQPDIRVAGYQ